MKTIIQRHFTESLQPLVDQLVSENLSDALTNVMAMTKPAPEVASMAQDLSTMPASLSVIMLTFTAGFDKSKLLAQELLDSGLLRVDEAEYLRFIVRMGEEAYGNSR